LARNGTPFHRAHQIAGRLVLESVKQGRNPRDWNGASLVAFDPAFTPEMAQLLDPREGMKSREIAGGTGPGTVSRALAEARQRLAGLLAEKL
jgi:argininosuccinate lyase